MTRIPDPLAQTAGAFGRRLVTPAPKARAPAPRKPAAPLSRRRKIVHAVIALATVALLLGGGGAAVWLFKDLPALPEDRELWAMAREPGITFEDVHGRILATRGARNGYRLRLDELPDHVPQAFLAAEDRRFYQHGPVEFRSIGRAAFRNLREDGPDHGGSTLTQQIARTIFLTQTPSLKRKLQEAIIAWRLERRMTKDEILELYLNRIYFGARSYGLEAASLQYFGHSARTLTIAEAALLASLPKAPSRLALDRNLPAALERSQLVLAAMREEGWITSDDERLAVLTPPVLSPPPSGDREYGYVLDLAAAEATAIAGPNAPDLVVRMTIDPELQVTAQTIVTRMIAQRGARLNASQAALIAMTPDGAIRAVVGGVDHHTSPFNRATQARRQPGSTFKPLIYAAALERGVSPNEMISGGPVRLGSWRPANYGGAQYGSMTVQQSLVYSVNTAAVRLADRIGREKIGEISRRFGITTLPDAPDLSASLGAYEVTLRELTGAFQVFQNAGERHAPHLITTISTSSGELVYQHPDSAGAPAYDITNAGHMVRMMEGVVLQGTARAADIGRPAAGKTGTSQDWRDAWFVGFTPDWAAGVWVGNDDSTSMNRVTGGDLPAQIWRAFMLEAHRGIPAHDFDFIPDLPPPAEEPSVEPGEGMDYARVEEPAAQAPPANDDPGGFYNDLAQDFLSGPR